MAKEKLTLEELGREYEKYAELQQYFIDKCKADIKNEKMLGNSKAVDGLTKKLRRFREIQSELKSTAEKLKNYYKGEA